MYIYFNIIFSCGNFNFFNVPESDHHVFLNTNEPKHWLIKILDIVLHLGEEREREGGRERERERERERRRGRERETLLAILQTQTNKEQTNTRNFNLIILL